MPVIRGLLPLAVFLAVMLSGPGGSAGPLGIFQWEKRVLLVFAPKFDDGRYRGQVALIKRNRDGILDRDMQVLEIIGTENVMGFPTPAAKVDARALRKQYDIGRDEFAALLIGKDGGVKSRTAAPADMCDLFDLIDGMAMRRDEMKERGKSIACIGH